MFRRLLSLFAALMLLVIGTLPANASAYGRVEVTSATKASYMAASTFVTPAASTTDLFEIYGSSSKTVKILRIEVAYKGSTTASQTDECFLLRRSTANSGGTSVTLANIPCDTNNNSATAVCKSYTANPTTGALVGRIAARIMTPSVAASGGTADTPAASQVVFDANLAGQPLVLRGTAEGVVVNFNGTIPSAGTPKLAVTFYWTEE